MPDIPATGSLTRSAAGIASPGRATAIAYSLWFRGIERLQVSQVSLLGLMSPVVATVAGWLIAHQTLMIPQIVGAGLVLAAVWFGQRTRPTAARP